MISFLFLPFQGDWWKDFTGGNIAESLSLMSSLEYSFIFSSSFTSFFFSWYYFPELEFPNPSPCYPPEHTPLNVYGNISVEVLTNNIKLLIYTLNHVRSIYSQHRHWYEKLDTRGTTAVTLVGNYQGNCSYLCSRFCKQKHMVEMQGRPLHVHEYTMCLPSCQKNDDLTLKRMFSASRSFLNFENRTIIKEDMVKNVTEGQICSDRAGADLCVTPNSCPPNFGQWASL